MYYEVKIRVTLEKSKERIAKFADCWEKAHKKLSLNWIQCTERKLFHIEKLPDGYLILKRVDLVLKKRPDNKLNNKMWVGENNEGPLVAC